MMSLMQFKCKFTRKHLSLNPGGRIKVIKCPALLCIPFIMVFAAGSCNMVMAESDWSATLYGAVLLKGNLSDGSLLNSGFEDSYLTALAVAKRMASYEDKIDLELEGQIVKHFRGQKHWEFNALGIGRWLLFPWDEYLNTNFAFGAGLSFATETPKVEEERRGDDQTQEVLAYLLLELELGLPEYPNWSGVTRIHHRSGAFGLFNGVTGASNAWGVGIKYRF